MYKFPLMVVVVLFVASQLAAAQGGGLAGLRTVFPRLLARMQAQELATMEIELAAAASLRQLAVVVDGRAVSSPQLGKPLPPLVQARMMLHEREALLAVLRSSRHTIRTSLRSIVRLAGEGEVVVRHAGGATQQVVLEKASLSAATDFYTQNVRELVGEGVFVIVGSKEPLSMLSLSDYLKEHGKHVVSLLMRVGERKRTGRRDIARALRELGSAGDGAYLPERGRTAVVGTDFAVRTTARAEPIIDAGEETALLGIETKADIFEFAARLAATRGDGEAVRANLRSVLALNNDSDRLTMTIAVQDGEVVLLNEANLFEVQRLYLQIFAPTE